MAETHTHTADWVVCRVTLDRLCPRLEAIYLSDGVHKFKIHESMRDIDMSH
jgi:hypothetical protein